MPMENQDTISPDSSLRRKARDKQKTKNRKVKYYLSFMTIILIACVFQIASSALLNISKIIVYEAKIIQAQGLKEKAELKNKTLKNEIENFNSMQKVESIARNNLKMAGENEVLLIINDKKQEVKPKTKKEQIIEYLEKNIARKFIQNDSDDSQGFNSQ